jgi:hypothetical protein
VSNAKRSPKAKLSVLVFSGRSKLFLGIEFSSKEYSTEDRNLRFVRGGGRAIKIEDLPTDLCKLEV